MNCRELSKPKPWARWASERPRSSDGVGGPRPPGRPALQRPCASAAAVAACVDAAVAVAAVVAAAVASVAVAAVDAIAAVAVLRGKFYPPW